MHNFLPQARRLIGDAKLEYKTVSTTEYLLEVTVAKAPKMPANWVRINETKKHVRFHPPEVVEAVAAMQRAKDELAVEGFKAWQHFLSLFHARYHAFRAVVQQLAQLDCLLSLAAVASFPDFVQPSMVDEHVLEIDGGRHPVVDALVRALSHAFIRVAVGRAIFSHF